MSMPVSCMIVVTTVNCWLAIKDVILRNRSYSLVEIIHKRSPSVKEYLYHSFQKASCPTLIQPPSDNNMREADFECPLCRKRFPEKWRLNRHVDTHAPRNMYACAICGFVTTQTEYIKRHIKTKHPEEHLKRKETGEAAYIQCSSGAQPREPRSPQRQHNNITPESANIST